MSATAEDMQSALDASAVVIINDQEVTMGDLMNSNVETVAPFFGFEAFPAGLYDWATRPDAVKMEVMKGTAKGDMAVIRFGFVCAKVHAVKDKSIDPDELLGRENDETIFISEAVRDIGKARAICESAGLTWTGNLPQNLANFAQQIPGITAGITNTHIKEKDRTYANLDLRSIKPLVVQAQAAQAAPVGTAVPGATPAASAAPAGGGLTLG